MEGEAVLRVDALWPSASPFGRGLVLSGCVRRFTVSGRVIARKVPVRIYLATGQTTLSLASDYQVAGRLKRSASGAYLLKVGRYAPWQPVAPKRWFAQMRANAKRVVVGVIRGRVAHKETRELLCGLASGQFVDPGVLLSFRRLGLSHLMAISGFHFSVIAVLLGWIVRPWLGLKRLLLC